MFGLPGMLWWGAAIAVPVLIHLFARQRYKRLPWAAMDFLLRAFKKTRKRIRLEHLLLLLLRILAILFFVLALADPHLGGGALLGGGGSRRDVVIVLDNSFSMGLREVDGTTAWEHAREQALNLVHALSHERLDTVSLITAGRPASVRLIGTDDLERARSEIGHLKLGDGVTDLVGAFRSVLAALADLPKGADVFLFGDLQKSGFLPVRSARLAALGKGPEGTEKPQEILQSLMHQIRSKGAVVNMLAPPAANTDNVALTSLKVGSKVVIAGTPALIIADLKNFGSRGSGGTLRLFVDGSSSPVETLTVDTLRPGGVAVRAFRYIFQTPGSHYVEAAFLTDNLEIDNRRFLALNVRSAIRTLVVDGSLTSAAGEQASFYLTRALVPDEEGVKTPLFQLKVVEETALEGMDPSRQDLLVLMDLNLLSPSSAKAIQEFVEDGGGLLVFLGKHTKARVLNDLLYKGGSGVLPARIGKSVGKEKFAEGDHYQLELKALGAPPLHYFKDPDILPYVAAVPFYRYMQVAVEKPAPAVRVLARFATAGQPAAPTSPAILEKSLGQGRCILVTSSGDDSWNDLPAMPIYLPLMREMAYHLTNGPRTAGNLPVGRNFTLILKRFASQVVISRGRKPLAELKPLPRNGKRGFEVRLGTLEKAGIYRVALSVNREDGVKAPPRDIFLAVNVDPAESNLARVGEDFLLSNFPGSDIRCIKKLGDATKGGESQNRERTWWWLLLLAGLCLLFDTALSQLFGRRSPATGGMTP